jgi:hypothetical protein
MVNTLVLQSHTDPLPHAWLRRCMDTVKAWSVLNNFHYQFIDDELFEFVPTELLEKIKTQWVIATDLARIKVMWSFLNRGYERVVWCDADFLIFDSKGFVLPGKLYALGREVWIQESANNPGKLVARVKVHNAFLLFCQHNVFLDFYIDTAERLLLKNSGSMPPQFIGPKFLTAIHNVVQCPALETAGMLSPLVINDIVVGAGSALTLFRQRSTQPIAAANLCSSLCAGDSLSTSRIETGIEQLLRKWVA